MDKSRLDDIIEELKSRTSWGVCSDLRELIEARCEAEFLIKLIDVAIYNVEEFVKEFMPDPITPDDEDDE